MFRAIERALITVRITSDALPLIFDRMYRTRRASPNERLSNVRSN